MNMAIYWYYDKEIKLDNTAHKWVSLNPYNNEVELENSLSFSS